MVLLEAKKISDTATFHPEVDCCGCLVRLKEIEMEDSIQLLIYLCDESGCMVRLERVLYSEDISTFRLWKKNMLESQRGSCLFFRNVRIISFDPLEDCAVGLWTDSTIQCSSEGDREHGLTQWFDKEGHRTIEIKSLQLSIGIPSNEMAPNLCVAYGTIMKFGITPFVHIDKISSLSEFTWEICIDSGISVLEAFIPVRLHTNFIQCLSSDENSVLSTLFSKKYTSHELKNVLKYLQHFVCQRSRILHFVLDSGSSAILQVKRIDPFDVAKLNLLLR
jgi:hypothetical protein